MPKHKPVQKVLRVGFASKGISDTYVHLPQTLGIDSEGVTVSYLGAVERARLLSRLGAYDFGGLVEDIIHWRSVETGASHIYVAAAGSIWAILSKQTNKLDSGRAGSRNMPDTFVEAGPVLLCGNGIDNNTYYSPIGGTSTNKNLSPVIVGATSVYFPDSGLEHGETYAYKARYVDVYGNRGPFSSPRYVTVPGHISPPTSGLWRNVLEIDDQTTDNENYDKIEIYRTQKITAGTAPVFYWLDEIQAHQDSYTDFMGDTLLALNPAEQINATASPNFGAAVEFLGRLFAGNNIDEPRVVRYTTVNKYFEFPPENLFQFPQAVVGFAKLYDKIAVFCRDSIYIIVGDSQGNIQAVPAVADIGLDHKNLVQVVNGKCYFVYRKRIYVFDGFNAQMITPHLEIFGDRAFGIIPQPAASVADGNMVYFTAAYDDSLSNSIVMLDTVVGSVNIMKPVIQPKAGPAERITALARYHDLVIAGSDQGKLYITGSDIGDLTTPYIFSSPFMHGDDLHSKKSLTAIYVVYSAVTSKDLQLEIFVNGYEGKAVDTQVFNLPARDDCSAHLNGWDEKNWGDETWVDNPVQVQKLCFQQEINFETIKLKISKSGESAFASIVDIFVEYVDRGVGGLAEC